MTGSERDLVDQVTTRIVERLLDLPVAQLRRSAASNRAMYERVLADLFGLDERT